MKSIAQAWEIVAEACSPLPAENVRVEESLGRILASDARSAVDLPPFDRSAMDGYAVRSSEARAGSRLTYAGELLAGDSGKAELQPGSAVAVMTGTAIPPGADSVIRVEATRREGDAVICDEQVEHGENVRRTGEDVRRGDVLVAAGRRVTVQGLSGLASAGIGTVQAHRRPRVAVLATGSELLPIGAPPEPGRIHESNRLVLSRLAERAGAAVTSTATVPDDAAATRDAIAGALEQADVVLISGGVSVGVADHVKPALAEIGVEELLWRVRLKPGRPLWIGRRRRQLVFGLPGNPLSALVCCLAFVEPALRRLQGEAGAVARSQPARLAAPARATDDRTNYLAATLARDGDGVLHATPLPAQGSHLTGRLAHADGFVIVDHDAGLLPAGTLVEAVILD